MTGQAVYEAAMLALYGLLVLNILAGAACLLWYAVWTLNNTEGN